MKKTKLFLLTLLSLFLGGVNAAWAEDPYTVDFNTAITTSNHDFKVAPGWLHIVDSYSGGWSTNYVNYVYSQDKGLEGTGCLSANTNQASNSIYDLLVTPEVSGTVSLDVKCMYDPTNYDSSVKFFYVSEENGVLTRGDEIVLTGTQTSTEFNTVSFTLTEPSRVGIWINCAYIDNFFAQNATVVLQPALSIVSAVSNIDNNSGYVYENGDGNITFTYTVTVKNIGEREIVAGEDNYSVSIVNYKDLDNPVGTTLITQNLAVNETSSPIEITALYPLTSYPSRTRFDAKENISNTTKAVTPWVDPIAYKPEFVFCTTNSGSALEDGTAYAFGKVNEATDVTYRIRNTGGAPLTINSITAPAGYTVDVSGPFEVAAGGEQLVKITLWSETPGSYSGNVVISYKDADAVTQNFNLAVSGLVLDATKWYATFNDQKFPAGTMHDSSWETAYSTNYNPNAYFIQSGSATTDQKLFISPLLHATANEELMFDAARRSTSTGEEYHLGVYYSTDRENWILIRDIANSEFSTDKASSSSYSDYQFSTFVVNIPVEGDFYVGFSAGYVRLDNIYGLTPVEVDHDILFSATLPTEGTVNYDVTVKTTINNLLAKTEKADSYTLKYYVGGEVVAEATAIDLTTGVENTFNIVYTPRAAGSFETKVVLALSDGTTYESESATLVVAGETAIGETQVGEKSTTNSSILLTNYTSSETETVYVADELSSIPANTAISSLAFIGTRSTEVASHLKVYMQNTDDVTPKADGDVSAMILVYDGDYTHKAVTNGKTIDLMLSSPFTYTGGNLRVFVQSVYNNGSGFPSSTTYQVSSTSNTKYRRQDNVTTLSTNWSSGNNNNPIIVLGYKKEASTFSGTLKMDGTALADVTITLTSGNVMYSGKTNNRGRFDFPVLQDNKTYTITTDYSEKSYFPFDDQVTFAGTSVVKSINLVEAVDFLIEGYTASAEATVNSAYIATVDATNYNLTALAADSYSVTLYVDGKAVATAEAPELASKETKTFEITYMPHTAGDNLTAYIELAGPSKRVKTEDFTINIAEETLKNTATAEADGASSVSPLYLYYYNSESVSLFTSDVLANSYGLSDGAKIKSITFKGYKTTDPTTSTLNVWYEWTDDATQSEPADGLYDTSGLKQIIEDQNKTWPKDGSEASMVDFITLTFDEPLVYNTGKSLRIVMRSNSSQWKQAFFEKATSETDGLNYYHYNDDKTTFESNSWTSSRLPVMHLSLVNTAPTLAGTVKTSAGQEIVDAEIVLKANNGVQYSGVTDTDGKYSIPVIQTGLSYNVTATNGEVSATGRNVSFADGDVTKNFVLGTISLGDVPEPAIYAEVVLERTLKRGWNAVVLPFAVSAKELATACGGDDGIELAEYAYDEGDTEVIVIFKDVDTVEANVPFLLYLPSEDRENPEFANVDLAADEAEAVTKGNVFDFVGVYHRTDVNAGDYFIQGGKFVKASTGNYVLPYRSYLKLKDTAGARSIRFVIGDNQVVTAINGLTIDATSTEGAYNLQGQKVEQLKKGNLYIINGKKVLVK